MDAYVGQIMLFAGPFCVNQWMPCDGRSLAIGQYQLLYALIGTLYGGNGVTNFNIPDLRGRIPINCGQGRGLSNYAIGKMGGAEKVALTVKDLPIHAHTMWATTSSWSGPEAVVPANALFASSTNAIYGTGATATGSSSQWVQPSSGRGEGHENMMPYLTLNWLICYNGAFPSRD